jgi:hypothetical protein
MAPFLFFITGKLACLLIKAQVLRTSKSQTTPVERWPTGDEILLLSEGLLEGSRQFS